MNRKEDSPELKAHKKEFDKVCGGWVHPEIVVHRWLNGHYSKATTAVEDFVYWSIMGHARNLPGQPFYFSCETIAARMGGGLDKVKVWDLIKRSAVVGRSGKRGERKRAWDVIGGRKVLWNSRDNRYEVAECI